MRDFVDLPHTIASNITGCEIETIRRTDQCIIDLPSERLAGPLRDIAGPVPSMNTWNP